MSSISAGTTSSTALVATADTSGSLVLQTNNGTTAVTIDTSQNVGIGTTSPGAKLDVTGSIRASVNVTSAADFVGGGASGYAALYANSSGGLVICRGSSSTNQIELYTNGSERMRITSGGNVGINTTPVAMSNGVGTQTGQSTIVQNIVGDQSLFANNAYYDSGWKAVRTQTGYSCMRPGALTGGIQFMCSSAATTAGGSLPNMDGSDIKLSIYASGSIGAPTGSNIYNASDARLKKNIQPLAKGLDAVVALKPVSFNWITDFCEDENDKILYGFIAQETREVDENLVEGFSRGGSIIIGDLTVDSPMRVNEKFIVPMLVKAIQEQQALITSLTARIAALEGTSA